MKSNTQCLVLSIALLSCATLAQPALAEKCGVERWAVKTGTDADAGRVDLAHPQNARIADLIAIPAPLPIPATSRVVPTETTVFVVDATLIDFRQESDSDYHLVLQDEQGRTMIAEIPSPGCVGAGSPFSELIANARALSDSQLAAGTTLPLPVRVAGVGFFDFFHNQRGVAPNAIELHPVVDIDFNPPVQQSGEARGTATSPASPMPRRNVQEWEYRFIKAANEQDVIDQATKLSAEKWEMVSVVRASGAHGFTAFLKRQKR